MAQDIRKLFDNERQNAPAESSKTVMPEGHEARFMDKLDAALPVKTRSRRYGNWKIAASIVVLLGLSFWLYQNIEDGPGSTGTDGQQQLVATPQSLGEVSPQLQKVEDYYLANINLELSKMEVTPENKELFDGYLTRLEDLNSEYEALAKELLEEGPSEATVNALINNLKFRLNLLYQLKEKLHELNASDASFQEQQS